MAVKPQEGEESEALITEYTKNFAQQLKEIERTHDSLTGQLEALVEVFELVIKDQNLCLCGMMAAELTALDKSTQQALRKFFALTEDWVTSAFDRHQPTLSLQLPHEQLAQVFVSGLEGAMLLDRTEDNGKRLKAFRALVHSLIN